MKKSFIVSIDVTMAVTLYGIEAESEEEAARIVKEKVDEEPMHYVTSNWQGMVSSEVTDVDLDQCITLLPTGRVW